MRSNRPETWEEACQLAGIDPNIRPDVSMIPDKGLGEWIIGCYENAIISAAIKGDFKADFTDRSTWKYFPRLWVEKNAQAPSGVALSSYDCVRSYTFSSVGSRLSLESAADCEYSVETFPEIHRKFHLG